jgi:ferrous iron transport protein B
MSTRVITNYRERLVTILIAPLMSCSARLPVYVLLIAAFVPPMHFLGGLVSLQALTMLGLYLLGIVAAIGVAWVLKKFFFRHEPSSFVIELPPYKLPQLGTIWRRMREGGWAFIRDAGTLIVAMTILVWAAAYFPHSASSIPAELKTDLSAVTQQLETAEDGEQKAQLEERQAELEAELDGHYLRQSYLARAGRLLEPAVRPLGWDWRIGSAVLASFPAREVVVSTMGVIFGLGSDTDENSESLRTRLQEARWEGTERPLFNLPMALGLLVFFALCAQCVSTLAVIKRETNSWRWPLVTFAYMTLLAYLGALLTYQLGRLFF